MEEKQTHYKFVHDKSQILKFAELFLPVIEEEPYFVLFMYLAARRKYNPVILNRDRACFNRKIIRKPSPQSFYELIRQYEVPLDAYTSSKGDPLPNDAMVVYCVVNPRCTLKAWQKLQPKVWDKTIDKMLNNHDDLGFFKKLDEEYKSCLHASQVKKYIELDIDTKDEAVLEKVRKFLSPNYLPFITCTIETQGGYHIVLDFHSMGKELRGKMYQHFQSADYKFKGKDIQGKTITKLYVDVRNDPVQPVPGTYQAGFKVRFVDFFN